MRQHDEKHFSKELVITKQDAGNFHSSTKCLICDHTFIKDDVKVRDHCHAIGKYKDDVQRDCNIHVSLNFKKPTVSDNLKNYDALLNLQNLEIFDFKINDFKHGSERYMSLSLDNRLVFIDSFHFSSSSLDS